MSILIISVIFSLFSEDPKYRESHFSTCPEELPVFAQFCGNKGSTMLEAALLVEDKVSAVDINFGCPQGIARKGNYGSYLLEQKDVVVDLISSLHKGLTKIPVTCKMRKVLPGDMQQTLNLIREMEAAGASVLCFHCRTKEQKGQFTGAPNWDDTVIVKKFTSLPLIANGGIEFFEDIQKCLDYTGAQAVMSSEAVLENPALFQPNRIRLDDLAVEYIELCKKYPVTNNHIKPHLFKMLHKGLSTHTDIRDMLIKSNHIDHFENVVRTMKERRDANPEEAANDLGWYRRYRKVGDDVNKDKSKKDEEENDDPVEKNCKRAKLMDEIEAIVDCADCGGEHTKEETVKPDDLD